MQLPRLGGPHLDRTAEACFTPRHTTTEERDDMDLKLRGKKVLITGGSKGIGASLGHAFAAEGANIILVSRSAEALKETGDAIRSRHQVSVETHAAGLLALQRRLEQGEALRFRAGKYWIEARKPISD